jgi:hypothetical protein
VRAIDFAHPARAEPRDDFIPADASHGREHHFRRSTSMTTMSLRSVTGRSVKSSRCGRFRGRRQEAPQHRKSRRERERVLIRVLS